MRAFWTAFVCCVFWLAFTGPGPAQERYALLIGNKDYSKNIGPLTNPINDVELVRSALIEVGFKRENIEVLINAKESVINRARKMFGYRLKAAGPDALGFFYYSGHGAASKLTETGQISNFIIPIDVEDSKGPVEMFASSVPLNNVVTEIRDAARFADLIVVFDACRSELQMSIRAVDSKTFVAESLPANGNTLLGFSTSSSFPASDTGEHGGPFATALAQELVRADQYHEQVFYNVSQAVIQATNHQQIPYYLDGIKKRLYFVQKQAPLDLKELTLWNDTLAANSVEAYRTYLHEYPESSRAREAIRRMQARQEETDWNLAMSSGQREDFESFLSRYPNGRFYSQAVDQLAAVTRAEEDRDWRIARNSNSEAKILAFFDKYPRSQRYDEAQGIIRRLRQTENKKPGEEAEQTAWGEARSLDSIPAYSKYLTSFGDGAHAAAARQRLSFLTELQEWQDVRESRVAGVLQNFVQKYPTGPHAQDARELIAAFNQAATAENPALGKLVLQTKGISEDLFKQQKRLEQQNLFFPQGTFARFNDGKISSRLDLRKSQPIRRLLLTNNLTNVYSGGDDGAVRIWDLNGVENNEMLSPAHKKRIYAIARSDNSRYMATGSLDRQVFLWDSHTNTIAGTVAVRPKIYSMAFSPTGRWIAAAGSEGLVDFIRVRDQRIVNRRHTSAARTIFSLAYLPNKSEDLVLGDASGALRIWSVISGHERYVPSAHSDKILTLTVNFEGSVIASAGLDRSIKLWSNTLAKTAEIKQAHRQRVTALRFTPDGRYLASGGGDALVRIWDAKTLKPVHAPFAGHIGDVEDIEFSPDGKYMFTSSEDKTVKIWDVEDERLLYTLIAFRDGGYVIFDQQQRYLASDDVRSLLKGH